jgi:ribosome-binding factor A
MESIRQNKIGRLLQKELANIFQKESKNLFNGKLITVTVVRVSPDLSLAKVYLSIFPFKENDNFSEIVNQSAKTIKNYLGKRIRHQVRIIPELVFYQDDSLDYIENINKLLKS